MANVDVSLSAVQSAMSQCVAAATELQNAAKNLQSMYSAAGSGWKDSKYKELGAIVETCNAALKEPVSRLGDCYRKLSDLQKIIEEYMNS
ncbi:MAG: hypothetical protein LUF82_01660 [Clostridia bacterium]|nr:hypothetical protein [Clostridia bacterium]